MLLHRAGKCCKGRVRLGLQVGHRAGKCCKGRVRLGLQVGHRAGRCCKGRAGRFVLSAGGTQQREISQRWIKNSQVWS